MERVYVTQFTYVFDKKKHGEKKFGKSLTLPDQSYSIQEMLEKFVRGIPVSTATNGGYDDDPDMDNIDPSRMADYDLTTLTEMQEEYSVLLKSINEEVEKKKSEPVDEPEDIGNPPDNSTSSE